MQLIPAIDLMNGKIVRLSKGNPKTAKIYEQFGDPIKTAQKWQKEGATKLHIIDLDAALGSGNNLSTITNIIKEVNLPIQLGGGIRSITDVDSLIKLGIKQVILGALPFKNPEHFYQIIDEFGSKTVIVALDNKNGNIMIEGWKTRTKMGINDSLEKFLQLGIDNFLVTSIVKDGTLSGPDLKVLREINRTPKMKIIAAGGIGKLEDLINLKRIGIEGAVIGKALYENRFSFKEALQTVGGKQN
jgi:phosphoribosylformimino-5-aminoimidazole carboxamide ribotide isomerase